MPRLAQRCAASEPPLTPRRRHHQRGRRLDLPGERVIGLGPGVATPDCRVDRKPDPLLGPPGSGVDVVTIRLAQHEHINVVRLAPGSPLYRAAHEPKIDTSSSPSRLPNSPTTTAEPNARTISSASSRQSGLSALRRTRFDQPIFASRSHQRPSRRHEERRGLPDTGGLDRGQRPHRTRSWVSARSVDEGSPATPRSCSSRDTKNL